MKIKRFQFLFCLMLTTVLVQAETMIFGGAEGWGHSTSNGLREVDGWKGMAALTLSPLGRNPFNDENGDTDSIDLLVLAEPTGLEIPSGYYHAEGVYEITQRMAARTDLSIRPGPGGIRLYPSQGAMWQPGAQWGNFTFEFFLCPSQLRDGERFFSWEGRDSSGETQSVSITVEKRRLVWEFRRFFQLDIGRSLTLILTSPPLVPNEWHHHRVVFTKNADPADSSGNSPGYFEYQVDGLTVDAVHATTTGREEDETFSPRVGSLSDQSLNIAPEFNGFFDELRLTFKALSTPYIARYFNQDQAAYGVGITEPIDAEYPGSSLQGIRTRYHASELSRISFFARAFDDSVPFGTLGLPDPSDPNWMMLSMKALPEDPTGFGRWFLGEPEQPIKGRYFVIGYILQPDSGADIAPSLSVLEVSYTPRLPPLAPRDLKHSKDSVGRIIITWNPVAETDVAGWWVFWGSRPGVHSDGMAWIPRMSEAGERPQFIWPSGSLDGIVYAVVRAAWQEGAPDTSQGPAEYKALSPPSPELRFRR